MLNSGLKVFIIAIFLFGLSSPLSAQSGRNGRISGQLVDAETGESLPGAAVMIKLVDKTVGASSGLDGIYAITGVPDGKYTLEVFLAGYAKTSVEDIEVTNGEATRINLALKSEVYEGQDVIVQARAIENNEAILLKKRQKSIHVSNAISAETMSNLGIGNAADAVSKVVGGNEQGGKYVSMRGLSERYVTSHLNGIELPSADPDKKAFQMDLLPSNLLDNIEVVKSFTPEKPGNFSGGIIDIGTKTFPESFLLGFSASSSYNSQVNHNDNFLTYPGGDRDWLGMDDGSRDISDEVLNGDIPDYTYTLSDPEKAQQLDQYSKAFNSIMSPTIKRAPLNGSYAFSIGNQTSLFGKRFGYMGSLTYSRKYSFYEDGDLAYYVLSGDPATVTSLNNEWKMNDTRGSDEVLWGSLIATSYKLHSNHEIGLNFIHTQSGESTARYINGHFHDGNLDSAAMYETRVLSYVERTLNSLQVNGKHFLPSFARATLEWNTTYTKNSQNEPDTRFFSNHYIVTEEDGVIDTNYSITPSMYRTPQRYYRKLDEDNASFDLKLSIPFRQWSGLAGKISLGGLYSEKHRDFLETTYNFKAPTSNYNYEGDPEAFFNDSNMGIVDSAFIGGKWRYTFNLFVIDASDPRANYTGDEQISAFFGMLDIPLSHKLRFIGGLRHETTDLIVAPLDTNYEGGQIDTKDALPSASLIYQLNDNTNIRAAYGRTLARPTFREMAPYPSWDFANEFYFIGNPELKRTLIDNFDLRWEWFLRPGEILAVSGFYKYFENPIERAIKHENGEIQYQNVDEAKVFGAEFELLKHLDFIGNLFKNFMLGANLTIIHSRVNIPENELLIIRLYDPGADDTRPFQGQSPYILNFDLTYNNSRTMSNLSFSIFGERLYEVSQGGTPDVYEQPRPQLDFVFNQRVIGSVDLKMSMKNILNATTKTLHHFKDNDFVKSEHESGRTFSIGLGYSM